MFDFLFILIFSERILFTETQSLSFIYEYKRNNVYHLIDIIIAIEDNKIKAEKSTYRVNYCCEPIEICAPTEQLLDYVTYLEHIVSQSLIDQEIINKTITLKIRYNIGGSIGIKEKENKYYIENFFIENEKVFDTNKPFSFEEKETQKNIRVLINTKSKLDKSKVIWDTEIVLEAHSFQLEKVKINNRLIYYKENASTEILRHIPLIFEKNSVVKTVYLDLKQEYEKTKTQESVLATKIVEIYGLCFVLSFVLTKRYIKLSDVKIKSRSLTFILVTTGIVVMLLISASLRLFLYQKGRKTKRKFPKINNKYVC